LDFKFMGRRSLALLQREVTYAENKAAFLAPVPRPPSKTFGYRSINLTLVGAAAMIKVRVRDSAVTRFGGVAALGLIPSTDPDFGTEAISPPRRFRPSKIFLVLGGTPSQEVAVGSKRPYTKYTADSTPTAPASFSSAISIIADPTEALQQAAAQAIKSTLGDSLPPYSRVWFAPEFFIEQL
jgi:hypothetical protein